MEDKKDLLGGEAQVDDDVWPPQIEPDDIQVLLFEEEPCACGHVVTHYVCLDLRAIGQQNEVLRGCQTCCEQAAQRLREAVSIFSPEQP